MQFRITPSFIGPALCRLLLCACLTMAHAHAATLSLLTGTAGSGGNFDGPSATAQLPYVTAVATDGAGNIYITTDLGTVKKVDAAGNVSALAGRLGHFGHLDGAGAAAQFESLGAIVADRSGTLHVLDADRLIRRIAADGQVTTLATLPGDARGLALSPVTGLIYAALEDASIVELHPDGRLVTPSWPMPWQLPSGNSGNADVAVDGADNLYVLALEGLYRLPPDRSTAVLVSDLQQVRQTYPYRIRVAVHPSGAPVYIADEHNVYRMSEEGETVLLAGPGSNGPLASGASDGTGGQALFSFIEGAVVDRSGNLLVADGMNNAIRRISAQGDVTTITGRLPVMGVVDGAPSQARFSSITGIAAARDGSLRVADAEPSGRSGLIRSVAVDGLTTTLLGSAGGMPEPPRVEWPAGIAVAGLGPTEQIFFVDSDECRVFRYAPPTASLAVLARCQWPDASLLDLNALALRGPFVYVASGNRVERLPRWGGSATVVAGDTEAGFQDGLAADARFDRLAGMVFDAAGNLYVSDRGNAVIRKISPDGLVSTFAGAPGQRGSVDGPGPDARFVMPGALAIDTAGNLYVADIADFTVRRISPSGSVQTIAGVSGVGRFMPGATPGGLEFVFGLAVHGDRLYIGMPQGIAVVQPLP